MRRWMVILWLLPGPAWAGNDLQEATDLFQKMSYARALQAAERVLRSSESGPREMIQAYQFQGLCFAALGKPEEAVLAFRRLLAIDPAFRLPVGTSPKLTPPFFQAIGLSVDKGAINLAHSPPVGEQDLRTLELEANLQADPLGMVKAIRFRYWSEGENPLQIVQELKGPGKIVVRVPRAMAGKLVKYTLQAINETGGAVAQAGGSGNLFELMAKAEKVERPALVVAPTPTPRGVQTPPPSGSAGPVPPAKQAQREEARQGTPWYKSWWFWTTVGIVVAAGAATGTALAVTRSGGGGDHMQYSIVFE